MIKQKLKSFFRDSYNLNNKKEIIEKISLLKSEFKKNYIKICKNDFLPNPIKLFVGVIIKIIGINTVKVVYRYLYKINKLNLKIFRYKSCLVHHNIDLNYLKNNSLCLFYFSNRKISKIKHSVLYKII